jgi:UDP-N-acetylglucosamine acyltransferase
LNFIGVNAIGLRRRGYDDASVQHIEDIYRALFVQSPTVGKGVEAISAMEPTPFTEEITSFISSSEKGIVKGLNG